MASPSTSAGPSPGSPRRTPTGTVTSSSRTDGAIPSTPPTADAARRGVRCRLTGGAAPRIRCRPAGLCPAGRTARRQVGVIAVDHRGFGRSSAVPSTFGFGGLVDDVATVLDGLDLFEAVVVGHSMGGGGGARPGDRTARRHRRSRSSSRRGQQLGAGPADRPLARAKVAVLDWAVTEQASRHRRLGMVAASELRRRSPPQPRHGGAEDRARQPCGPPAWPQSPAARHRPQRPPQRRARPAARPRGARSRPCAGRVGADRVVRRRCPTEGVQRSRAHVAAGALRRRGAEILGLADDVETGVAPNGLAVRGSSGLTTDLGRRWPLLVVAGAAVADGLGGRPVHIADHPIRSKPRISNAEVSSWPGSSPWRAGAGTRGGRYARIHPC